MAAASDDNQSQPLLSASGNNNIVSLRRRRRCKSAPAFELHPKASLRSPNSNISRTYPNMKDVLILMAGYIGLGTTCFSLISNQIQGRKTNSILDSIYFCVVTMTTVGYGDLVPSSCFAKMLASAFAFVGMALVALVLTKASDYLVEKQEAFLFKEMEKGRKEIGGDEEEEGECEKAKHKLVLVLLILAVLGGVGVAVLVGVEGLGLVDAVYCVCSTVTSLGYGDKSFSSEGGRAFAVVWILSSTICLGLCLLYMAEVSTENRQRAVARWALARPLTSTDLEAADLDNDGLLCAAEFIVYKLQEMGKIDRHDISLVMEEFDQLDVDQSGTLSTADVLSTTFTN